MKYKVLKAWSGVEVGQVLQVDRLGEIDYFVGDILHSVIPHEIAILVYLGFLEEVGKVEKWKPERGEKFWYMSIADYYRYNEGVDKKLFEAGNCFRTKEEAEAACERVRKALRNE